MSDIAPKHFRTPLARVRGRGTAKSGTEDFWMQRVTSVAGVPLTIMAIVIGFLLLGRNQAAAAQILGSPLVSIIMLLFVICTVVHMKIGMQEILVDYVSDEFDEAHAGAGQYVLLLGRRRGRDLRAPQIVVRIVSNG